MSHELWQIAKPFGRPAKFKTPHELWEAFIAYCEWATNNPMTVQDTKSQRKTSIKDERSQYRQTIARPLTLASFRLHAGIKREWGDFKKSYEHKSKDFCVVLRAIEQSVREQQVANAMVGNYKENIVSRINNISDTIRQEVSGNVSTTKSNGLSVQEARQFLAELDKQI
ncbi:MAG: DNA-packaging protein [Bacteroides sp.]|nr:DNA-packaging protein [Bacteroidales bacterium]MCM1068706.1 DNA-packaging protein [Prevotella sp.]MCM1354694.1 DNA-packaging protein [Bacteroides sp.]MCM1403758.1 DNA-packaging protein [Bacteroides sp.]MCM1443524.1 DNA-packaging protein [Muribaculum sp.]